jgi:hypothetical protein
MFQNTGTYLPNYMVCHNADQSIHTQLVYKAKQIVLQTPYCLHEVFRI